MLREECHALAYDDKDIECIPTLNMHITLHDTTPVHMTYISVPKPLHQEVKDYLQDLLNRGWISESRSPYSSPIVYAAIIENSTGQEVCAGLPAQQLLVFSSQSGQSMSSRVPGP